MKQRKLSMLLAAVLVVSTLAACGGDPQSGDDTTTGGATTPEVTEKAYDFGELDLKGETFTILNSTNPYSFYDYMDFEEETGETLDDSIFERNRNLEEVYKFELEIDTTNTFDQVLGAMTTAVLADEDIYDVVFIRDYYLQTPITEGYLRNLDESENFNFDEPWWDSALIENSRIGKSKKALFAQTDASLVDFEGTIVAFFNENLMNDLGLDAPYQLVRDGKWTFDKLCEYQKAGASLNGDDAYEPIKADGNAVYGHVGFQHSYNSIISSAGIDYVTKDNDGNLQFGIENEKFYDVAIKLSQAFAPEGEWLFANNAGSSTAPEHYEMLFKAGRALFMTAQLKASNNYRDMNDSYGIVPVPKWDENQENYSNLRTFSYVMCVPVTNPDLDTTATIMDAMSYLTYRDIMPYFYEGRIAQKNLRNEESVEMLEIIQKTRHTDLGMAYGMYNDMSNKISDVITQRSTDFASLVASIKPTIESTLEKIMNVMAN